MNDFQLLNKIKKNNSLAFKAFFDAYYKPLVNYINNYTKDPIFSEEIVQITFVAFWEKRHDLHIKTSVKSYLYTMAYNQFLKQIRDKKGYDQMLIRLHFEAIHNDFSSKSEILDAKLKKLDNALETLPNKSRKVIELKRKGWNNKDISNDLNISIKTVESQITKSFKKIRAYFNESKLFLFIASMQKMSILRLR